MLENPKPSPSFHPFGGCSVECEYVEEHMINDSTIYNK